MHHTTKSPEDEECGRNHYEFQHPFALSRSTQTELCAMATPGNVRNRTYIADARGQTGLMENSRQHDWTEAAGGFVIVLSIGWRTSKAAAALVSRNDNVFKTVPRAGKVCVLDKFHAYRWVYVGCRLGAVSIALAFPRLPVRSNALRPAS
jgi:hypothetical protein